MTPLPEDAWAPVPMLWSKVEPGDVVLDPDGRPWMVVATREVSAGIEVKVQRGDDNRGRLVQRDATVPTLVAVIERAAVTTLREHFGPVRVLDRKVS